MPTIVHTILINGADIFSGAIFFGGRGRGDCPRKPKNLETRIRIASTSEVV